MPLRCQRALSHCVTHKPPVLPCLAAPSAQATNVEERGANLNEHFTYSLYANVCRSLFEKDKLMFSFLLASRILQQRGDIDAREWRFLLAGPTATAVSSGTGEGAAATGVVQNPAPKWLTDKAWGEIKALAGLPGFAGFAQHFAEEVEHYRAIFDSNQVRAGVVRVREGGWGGVYVCVGWCKGGGYWQRSLWAQRQG